MELASMPQDPDVGLTVVFEDGVVKNEAKTLEAGRPIYDDREIVVVRFAGSRNTSVFPALSHSMWVEDENGEKRSVSYAERWRKQYEQFKNKSQQTKSGTPLAELPFLTEARRTELRALNIYTAEALADVDGQPLKNLGHNGRELKNQAIEFIEAAKANIAPGKLIAELEAMRAKNEVMAQDLMAIRQSQTQAKMVDLREPAPTDTNFESMTERALRDFIKEKSGVVPHGNPNRETLMRMAKEVTKQA
jgi:hypothetical protein